MTEPVVGTPEPDYSGYGTRQQMRIEIVRLAVKVRDLDANAKEFYERMNVAETENVKLREALERIAEEYAEAWNAGKWARAALAELDATGLPRAGDVLVISNLEGREPPSGWTRAGAGAWRISDGTELDATGER
jgi:hypothetical protein